MNKLTDTSQEWVLTEIPLSAEQRKALESIAQVQGTDIGAVVRSMVEAGVERTGQQQGAAWEQAVAETAGAYRNDGDFPARIREGRERLHKRLTDAWRIS